MEPRIHVITLAVQDLDRSLDFYRMLGLESPGVTGTEFPGDDSTPAGAVAMFELKGGLILALYPRSELAKDANVPMRQPKPGEFSIGQAVSTKEDVDTLLAQAEAAGATLTDDPHDRPWGIYSGYLPGSRRAPVGDHLEPAARGRERIVLAFRLPIAALVPLFMWSLARADVTVPSDATVLRPLFHANRT